MRSLIAALLFSLSMPAATYAQLTPQTAMLEQSGFDALKAGDPGRAAEAFRKAIASESRNARLYLGAGVAAWLQHRDREAEVALGRALELDPALGEARQFLGQVQYRLGDLRSAISTYEALVAAASDEDLSTTLNRWRRELDLQTRMLQVMGNHFTVSFEGPSAAELSGKVLESLDRAYWRIGEVLGLYPALPIPVVLYTSEQFKDITRSPSWAAAAYDGTIRVPMRGALEEPEELNRVLAHELTHAFVRSLGAGTVPTWLNEGLATRLEMGDVSPERSLLSNTPHVPTLATLAGSFERLNGEDAELAYASSAVAVDRLIDAVGGVAVANLVRDLNDGVDFETAFNHRMPWTFAEFSASLRR